MIHAQSTIDDIAASKVFEQMNAIVFDNI